MPKRFNSKKSNTARRFNSIMPLINEQWASKVLGVPLNPNNGPDLINDEIFVEVKFTIYPNQKDYIKWAVLGHQTEYQKQNKNKIGFWGLGIYTLKKPVSEIDLTEDLESLVISRELVIVRWNWMNQFPKYKNHGQTELSEWDRYLLHPKFNKLPKTTQTLDVEKGLVHFTNNINPGYFPEF